MKNTILYVFFLMFCLVNSQLREIRMEVKNQKKSVGCNSIESVKVVSKVECAIRFAQSSDVNLADFNVLQSTCEMKFCNQISKDSFEDKDDYLTIHQYRRK